LAALFVSPVVGYGLTKLVSGSFYGERYYYEAHFALCLLASRGLFLVWENRGRAGPMLAPALALCLVVYGIHVTVYARQAIATFDPFATVLAVSRQIAEPGSVVFLPPNLGRDLNENAPGWQAASVVYLEDPGELLRGAVVRILGRRVVYLITYDGPAGRASFVRAAAPGIEHVVIAHDSH
jgi:hypothetical protein